MKTKLLFNLLLIINLALVSLLQTTPVKAQAGSAADLIAAVNAYRAENGLAAYQVDSSLMSLAQAHSNYQASIKKCTHTRADGSGAGDHGISAENVACGTNLSVQGAIFRQWTDALHTATMLGPDTGLVGAGVAVADGVVYYTLDVKRLTGGFNRNLPTPPPNQVTSVTGGGIVKGTQPVQTNPLLTATPKADGAITHTIRLGQTLIEIAKVYGMTLDNLYDLNPWLDRQKPKYYEGQELVIRLAFTSTVTATITSTPLPPTRTPLPSRTATRLMSRTPTSTPTPAPLFSPPTPEDMGSMRRTIGLGFILVSLFGLGYVIIKALIKRKE